jgi:hypothetical protein
LRETSVFPGSWGAIKDAEPAIKKVIVMTVKPPTANLFFLKYRQKVFFGGSIVKKYRESGYQEIRMQDIREPGYQESENDRTSKPDALIS